jgi:signal transduction histidine kinase
MPIEELGHARILIVDDQEAGIKLLSAMLELRGYTNVFSTTDPRRARALFAEIQPDLVVLDLVMPELDGFGVLDELRPALDPDAYLPIIMLTGEADAEIKRRALSAGIHEFIGKPLDASEALLRIENLLRTRFLHLRMQNHNAILEYQVRKSIQELEQAQKLEAVGRLAAGIAHEINTPIQFVGDNVQFLSESFGALQQVIQAYRAVCEAAERGQHRPDLLAAVRAAEQHADLDYLSNEVPRAISQTLDGVARVAAIVRAMKDFAHPGQTEPVASDINEGIRSTLTVARNELKYVADVVTELGDLPLVLCHPGDLNQVFLNLFVNAAQAIEDRFGRDDRRGTITVRTWHEDGHVTIAVEDDGCGIPSEARAKIFEQFFTTKEVGRGTGQGLAFARSIVVDRHGGSLTFESEQGAGCTFYVRLPISGPALDAAVVAA